MINEDYVSFEVAKLLKEKGFNWDCITYYVDSEPDDVKYSMLFENNTTWEERCCSAPTHQMAMKWLREVHHYYIQIMLDSWALGDHSGYYVVIQKTDSDFEMMLQDAVDDVFYQTYEEAVEAALRYSLENLI
jgi:hypothetical protein